MSLIVMLFISACANSATTPTPSGSGSGIKSNVVIQGFSFTPASVTIQQGATVIWTNKDSVTHTVTSDSGTELDSESLANGQTYTHTFTTPGTYIYYCKIHPSMKGTVIVEAK